MLLASRREIESCSLIDKPTSLMCTVAEWFLLTRSASTESYSGSSTEVELNSFGVEDIELSFDTDWTV